MWLFERYVNGGIDHAKIFVYMIALARLYQQVMDEERIGIVNKYPVIHLLRSSPELVESGCLKDMLMVVLIMLISSYT